MTYQKPRQHRDYQENWYYEGRSFPVHAAHVLAAAECSHKAGPGRIAAVVSHLFGTKLIQRTTSASQNEYLGEVYSDAMHRGERAW